MEYSIYQLIDPRDSLPHYVGYTSSPKQRFQQHLTGDNTNLAKTEWIKELKSLGMLPVMQELEQVQGTISNATQRETYWIRLLSTKGMPLINTQSRPSYPKRIKTGYELREDLLKRLKGIAIDTERPIYEILEEALEEYLERKTQQPPT